MDEEPPEGGGVCEALWVGLLGVVIGGRGKDSSYDGACEFSELDSVLILEEVPPGGTEICWVMGVDDGDEGEAMGPLVWLGGGVGVQC